MGELVTVKHLTFSYPDQPTPVLDDINLTVDPGDFIVIAGDTGSGKTTLLNNFKKELMPQGTRTGTVMVAGNPIHEMAKLASAQTIGYVAQDPQAQPVMATVIEELAFPLENIAVPAVKLNAELPSWLISLGWIRI